MSQPFGYQPVPGESEFSYGQGLSAPEARGHEPTQYEQLVAMRQTDSANPNASEEGTRVTNPTRSHIDPERGTYVPGDLRPEANQMVRETGPSRTDGSFKRIDTSQYNPGHHADGQQDGLGQAWRDSLPPNPVV
jgi:hypothetical protein